MYKDCFIVKYKKKNKNEFRKLNCNKMLWNFFYVKIRFVKRCSMLLIIKFVNIYFEE